MLPNKLTHAEVGAYLVAVGQHMVNHDVCAAAVLDFDNLDIEYFEQLALEIRQVEPFAPITKERAEELLRTLTLEEAIDFNEVEHRT